jgi:hypothetical protein
MCQILLVFWSNLRKRKNFDDIRRKIGNLGDFFIDFLPLRLAQRSEKLGFLLHIKNTSLHFRIFTNNVRFNFLQIIFGCKLNAR